MRRVRVSSHHSPVQKLGDSHMKLTPKFRLAATTSPSSEPEQPPWETPLIPGLPDDAALNCLLRLPVEAHGACRLVCRRWRHLLADKARFFAQRKAMGLRSPWLFTLAFHRCTGKIQWKVLDLDCLTWHTIPSMPCRDRACPRGFGCIAIPGDGALLVCGGLVSDMDCPLHLVLRRLLTVPKSVGYEQNPLSVYYCYDAAAQEQDEHLKMCIAEVTNTPWGEKVMFTFQPGSDLVAKPLHVSPFMDMLGNWSIRADAPGNNLYVAIAVQHPTLGNYFTAALDAKLVGQTNDSVKLATFFWLMPHKVAAGIYWEAFRLWLKNVRFLDHPRYLGGSYRAEALKRDLEIRSSCSFIRQKPRADIGRSGTTTIDEATENSNHQDYKDGGGSIGRRWCVWRDAQWPWC